MEETAITFKVLLQPRASREGIDGLQGDTVKVRVTAPPLEGKANKALKRFIAKKLRLSSSQVEIIAGQHSRKKLVRISGISKAEVEKALGCTLPLV
jgi:uncharacterized protein (TIGR00251 family)